MDNWRIGSAILMAIVAAAASALRVGAQSDAEFAARAGAQSRAEPAGRVEARGEPGPVLRAETNSAQRPAANQRALEEADRQLAQVSALPLSTQPALAADVTDPVFAYMVGLLDHDQYGTVTQEHFAQAVSHSGRRSRIPHQLIHALARAQGTQPRSGWVRAEFTRPVDVAVPYSILGYHPGALISSPVVTFEEWRIGRTLVPNILVADAPPIEVDDLILWGVVDGQIRMDIDGWVDALLGGKLDDTYVVGLALFRYRGERLALALGFNQDGEGRSGVLDVHGDKIRFPAPPELKVIARDLRGRVLQRLAQRGIAAWVPPGSEPDAARE